MIQEAQQPRLIPNFIQLDLQVSSAFFGAGEGASLQRRSSHTIETKHREPHVLDDLIYTLSENSQLMLSLRTDRRAKSGFDAAEQV